VQAVGHKRWPNLALVFFVFILWHSIFVFWKTVCFCCIRFDLFGTGHEIGGKKVFNSRVKWCLSCWEAAMILHRGSVLGVSCTTTTTTVLRPFFRDHPGEPVPEENFWTLWYKARLTDADTLTIRLGATPSGLTSALLHHPPYFYGQDALPAAQPTVSKH